MKKKRKLHKLTRKERLILEVIAKAAQAFLRAADDDEIAGPRLKRLGGTAMDLEFALTKLGVLRAERKAELAKAEAYWKREHAKSVEQRCQREDCHRGDRHELGNYGCVESSVWRCPAGTLPAKRCYSQRFGARTGGHSHKLGCGCPGDPADAVETVSMTEAILMVLPEERLRVTLDRENATPEERAALQRVARMEVEETERRKARRSEG